MRHILIILLFTAAMAGGAQVEIPLGPVPFILSDFFVLLAGLVLGPIRGLASVLLYLMLGAFGLPVYAGGSGGIEHLMGPTGGFLFGFAIAAVVTGFISGTGRKRIFRDIAATLSGQISFFVVGLVWLHIATGMSWANTLEKGLLPFVFPIIVKLLSASFLASPVRRAVQ